MINVEIPSQSFSATISEFAKSDFIRIYWRDLYRLRLLEDWVCISVWPGPELKIRQIYRKCRKKWRILKDII